MRWITRVFLLSSLILTGCKSSGSRENTGIFGRSDTDATPVARTGDPLFGDRIPKQNLPTKSSDVIGAKGRDPLYGLPSTPEKPPVERAGKPDNKGSASLSNPYPEPFRPNRDTTNAALAMGLQPDDSLLSVGPRRTPGTSTSRGLLSYEQMVQELRRLGAKIGEPTRENSNYVMRAEVPIDADVPGPARWYEGFGSTPAAALRQILDQVRADRLK